MERIHTYNQGSYLFVPDDEDMFLPAEAVESFEKGKAGKVKFIGNRSGTLNLTAKQSAQTERMDPQSMRHLEDMIGLKLLNDASLLHNLRQRYMHEDGMKIYTDIGAILVSINPYKVLGLYTPDQEKIYLEAGMDLHEKPPHVFKVAEFAFQAMMRDGIDQSCVVTGESGAGKTEATKRFLQYISEKSKINRDMYGGEGLPDSENLRQQILDANPFMEAFGNAKTVRNDNSSRFGKLIDLYFDNSKGVLVGAKVQDYLLEKSRVCKVGEGERNYHIFYQLCAAAASTRPEFKKKYHLQTADKYYYTLGGNKRMSDLIIEDENDAALMEETIKAMEELGFHDDEIGIVFKIVSAILHLGNCKFTGTDEAKLDQKTKGDLLAAADLFEVDPISLEKALLERDLGKILKADKDARRAHKHQEAIAARDALSKHVYNNLFEWLIQKMNVSLNQHTNSISGTPKLLAVLDIFGFESFEVNSFEQMCINYCNEKLQAFFNDHVFKREQKVYAEEGIDSRNVGFYDNMGVVNCIENGPKSIMVICDDQCWLESATDKIFLSKILAVAKKPNEKDAYLQAPRIQDQNKKKHLRDAFKIIHYAGPVHYNVHAFLEKNKDQLRLDLRSCIGSSKIDLLSSFFPEEQAGKSAKYTKTLGKKFKDSLNRLMDKLNSTTPQFIRTIKPNEFKKPSMFTAKNILRQLREAGLLEVCKIRKMGYPVRQDHQQFMRNYLCLDKSAKGLQDLCNRLAKEGILNTSIVNGSKTPNWQIGKTKVFMRAEQADELETLRSEALKGVLRILHRAARSFIFRLRLRKASAALVNIRKAIKDRDAMLLKESLDFFLKKGVTDIPIVKKGQAALKEMAKELEILSDLKGACEEKNIESIKVNLELARDLGLGDREEVKEADTLLARLQLERQVKKALENAIGSADVDQLKAAIKMAEDNDFAKMKQLNMAKKLLETLKEREELLEKLKAALKDGEIDKIKELVELLIQNGVPDDHPLIVKAVETTDMIIEQNKERERRIGILETQLRKNIASRDLKRLKDLVNVSVKMKYTGPLVQQAVGVIQALERRNELIAEVVKSSRILRSKAKMADGIEEGDLRPLEHAIGEAEKVVELDLGNEVQVRDGRDLLKLMREQLIVQKEIKEALKKDTDVALFAVLKKVQRLGLQTADADLLTQRVREFEAIRAKAEAIQNRFRRMEILQNLKTFDGEEREKHLLKRIEHLYANDFQEKAIECAKNRDLAMLNFYRIRNDADFVEKESAMFKKERANLKLAYIPFRITKPLLEMDEEQEEIALSINRSILEYCERLGVKTSNESRAISIIRDGLADPLIADEIYVQLTKHLTANPGTLSKNRGWYLMCMCSTYFGCSKIFLPYLLHSLQNSVNDAGLEGNYARYTLAQLSMSMEVPETRYKPSHAEIKAFMSRPPVLARIEMVDGSIVDTPLPPDLRLDFGLKLLRRQTKIMTSLENPDWALYIRYTTKPIELSYKQRLQNFYRKYKPENLANVDSILKWHEGNEEALFADLVKISNYGPEPVPTVVGPKKKGKAKKVEQTEAYDDDDMESAYTTSSRSSIGSALFRAGSTISSAVGSRASRMLKRASGKPAYNIDDLEVPNPTIAWPLPWWAFMGDIVDALYQQDNVPILSFKRRLLKMKGKPDENLYLQLESEFLDGTLAFYTKGENARLSAIILAIRLIKLGKPVPYGDQDLLLKAGLKKWIPKTEKSKNKKHLQDFYDNYAALAAEKSREIPQTEDEIKLRRYFFEQCLQSPSYGMSFFFARILKGDAVENHFMKAGEDEGEAVKIGINQKEVAFFQNGQKYASFTMDDIISYTEDGRILNLKVKKNKANFQNQGDSNLISPMSSNKNAGRTKKRTLFGGKTETISLYSVQCKEFKEMLYFMHQGQKR